MRLLYVIDSLAPGGAETSLAEMAPGLVAAGLDLHVLPLGDRRDLEPALEAGGATVHRPRNNGGRLGNIQRVHAAAKRTRPDLVHTTLFEADVAGRTAAALAGIPSSTSLVGDTYAPARNLEVDPRRLRLALGLDRLTARRASSFHAVSQSLASAGMRNLGLPRELIDVIPRGRNAAQYEYQPVGVREALRLSLCIAPEAPVILAVGRLAPEKGHRHLLAALPLLTATRPDVVVLLAGKDGRAAADLRATADALRVDVRFLGHRTDVSQLLAAADVLCFPSAREGSPGSVIEAMAVGCPVVGSDIPSIREVLGEADECAGRLVDSDHPRELADALLLALSKDPHTLDLVRRGRARFEEQFTIERVVDQMSEFFARAVSGRPATRQHWTRFGGPGGHA